MRSAQDTDGSGGSATPIYDALYREYRRLFRTLPGDRTGEESLQFNGFGMWHPEVPPAAPGRHRGNGPAALPPGQGDNRLHDR
ncbi:hypothetical protein [Streptomyces sp. NPDC020983]|uniref:hypothetical protein n=1 Tax=Streptomyces sp. NPDC020983 TaxID=3365106 RepID=UPI0037912E0F